MPNWCSNTVTLEVNDQLQELLTNLGINNIPLHSAPANLNLVELLGMKDISPEQWNGRLPHELLFAATMSGVFNRPEQALLNFDSRWGFPFETMELLMAAYELTATVVSEEPGSTVYDVRKYENGKLVSYVDMYPLMEKKATKYYIRRINELRKTALSYSPGKAASELSTSLARVIKNIKRKHIIQPVTIVTDAYGGGGRMDLTHPVLQARKLSEEALDLLTWVECISYTPVPNLVDWECLT